LIAGQRADYRGRGRVTEVEGQREKREIRGHRKHRKGREIRADRKGRERRERGKADIFSTLALPLWQSRKEDAFK
jgi:hypothetical protein